MRRVPGGWRCVVAAALCALLASCHSIVHEERSSYSNIRVVDVGSQRALLFMGKDGDFTVHTLIDRDAPHRLQHKYARTILVGLLYRPGPSTGLLAGLGGGALVHFLNRHFPELRLDAVEIDPRVVAVAREFFGVAPGPRLRIFTEDGIDYLRRTTERYDIILMDAYLLPGQGTDPTGRPLRLKTPEFLRSLHERLRPGGVVLFNLIEGPHTPGDIEDIREAYAVAHVYRAAGSGNIIVAALPEGPDPGVAELRRRARALDQRGDYGFSFEGLLEERKR